MKSLQMQSLGRARHSAKGSVLQRGFSLLEMVVAVAILGISLGMLYQAAGGSTRSISTSEDYAYAVLMAQSLLANHSYVPEEGVNRSGETDDGYRWHVFSEPHEVAGFDRQQASVHLVEVKVSWGSVSRPREFTLHSAVPVVVEHVDAL